MAGEVLVFDVAVVIVAQRATVKPLIGYVVNRGQRLLQPFAFLSGGRVVLLNISVAAVVTSH